MGWYIAVGLVDALWVCPARNTEGQLGVWKRECVRGREQGCFEICLPALGGGGISLSGSYAPRTLAWSDQGCMLFSLGSLHMERGVEERPAAPVKMKHFHIPLR